MEANPGTVEHGRFAGYAQAGVNRVSLGAQSFDAESAQGARAHPRSGRDRGRGRRTRRRRHRELQSRPDVRTAAADAGGRARRPRGRDRARARAPLALPADARAGHGLPPPPAAAAGRRPRLRDAARLPGAARRRPALRSTRSPPTRGPAGSAGTTSTTGASATTSASAPAPTARRRSTARSSAPRSRARRASISRAAAGRPRSGGAVPAAELPFEFMLNALRLCRRLHARRFRARDRASGVGRSSEAPGSMRRAGSSPRIGPLPADRARFSLPERPHGRLPAGGKRPPAPPASCTQRLPGSCRIGTFVALLARCLNWHAITH